MIGGSANFTRHNLDDLNLEADLMITAPSDAEVMRDTEDYFESLWANRSGTYSVPYETYSDKLPAFKMTLYAIQKMLGFTTY